MVKLTARYRSPTAFEYVHEQCHDLSAGGMFICSPSPAPAGTLLKLECDVDSGGGPPQVIRGVARVVWQRDEDQAEGRPVGMGVKFVKLDPGSRAIIDSVLTDAGTAEGSSGERHTYDEFVARSSESRSSKPAPTTPVPASATLMEMPRVSARSSAPAAGPGPEEAAPGEGTGRATRPSFSADPTSSHRRTDPEFNSHRSAPDASARGFELGRTLPQGSLESAVAADAAPSQGSTSLATARDSEAASPPPPAQVRSSEAPAERDADPSWRAQRLRDLVEAQGGGPGSPGQPPADRARGAFVEARPAHPYGGPSAKWLLASLIVLAIVLVGVLVKRARDKPAPTPPAAALSKTPLVAESPKPPLPPKAAPTPPTPPASSPEVAQPAEALHPSEAKEGASVEAQDARDKAREQAREAAREAAREERRERRARAAAERARAAETEAEHERAAETEAERAAKAPEEPGPPPPDEPVLVVAESGETPEEAQPAGAAETPPAPADAKRPLEEAMACLSHGDNACVIRALKGKAQSAKELELLIETYRATGLHRDAETLMQRYVERYPGERRAVRYRQLLERRTQGP